MSTLKRVAVAAPQSAIPSKKARLHTPQIRLLSWNVDNPSWFLPADSQGGSIDKFFSPISRSASPKKPPSSVQKGKAKATDQSDEKAATPTFRDILRSHGWPDIVFLQEVRALHKDKETIRKLRDAPNHGVAKANLKRGSPSTSSDSDDATAASTSTSEPTYTSFFSLNRSKLGSGRFGVATYISSSFTEEYTIREVDWDHEGRLLLLTIPSLKLVLGNIYALNGSEYAWKDPTTNQERGTRNQRKREFNRLLMKECQEIQKEGYRLIMVGDWNISLEARDCFPRLRTEEPHALARKEFNEDFIKTLDVVDIFREKHGDKRSYSWFSPSKPDRTDAARVDYALVSKSIQDAVAAVEYMEDPKHRHKSDHCPIRMTVDTAGLEYQFA